NYDKSVDIYALGVLLYEMLTGAPPFDGESAQEVMMKHLMSLPDLNKVPPAFKPALAKALAKDPQHRHQTAQELVKDVEEIFGEGVPKVKAPRGLEAKRASKPVDRGRVPLAIPVARPVGKAVEIPLRDKQGHSPLPPEPLTVTQALPFRSKLGEL